MTNRLTRESVIAHERSMSDAESVRRARKAVELELEKRKAMNLPIAIFDKKQRKVFACYPDGTKVDIDNSADKGHRDGQ